MKKLSEVYKETGIDFNFPIKIKDSNDNETYFESSDGFWRRREYDKHVNVTYFENSNGYWRRYEYNDNSNRTYYENSDGYWCRSEYDKNDKETYFEDSYGLKRGTKRQSCDGKVITVDGKKYELKEL